MKQDKTRWEATGTPGLYVRQPGGGYYARITLNGKRSWRSLKTDKIREAQKLLRDLQSGHTRQVSTRTEDKLHAAMTAVIEFRSIRRALKNRQLKKTTQAFHNDILETAKKLFPDRPMASFDTTGLLRIIQGTTIGASRRKAIFELVKRTFATAVENGVIQKNPLAGHIPGQVKKKERTLPTREQLDGIIEVIPTLYPRYGHRAVFSLRFLPEALWLSKAISLFGPASKRAFSEEEIQEKLAV